MATLWPRITASSAAASDEWITRLARGVDPDGDERGDPRGIDARRADVLVALLPGHLVVTDTARDQNGAVWAKPVGADRRWSTSPSPTPRWPASMTSPQNRPGTARSRRIWPGTSRWTPRRCGAGWWPARCRGRCSTRPHHLPAPVALAEFVRARDVVCRNRGAGARPRPASSTTSSGGARTAHQRGKPVHVMRAPSRTQRSPSMARGPASGPTGRVDHPDPAPLLEPTPRPPWERQHVRTVDHR